MQLPYLSVQDGGVCLGSACSLGCETLHMSLAESYPNIIRPMTPPQHGDDKAWDYLSESGAQILRDKNQRLLRRVPTHVNYHSHWFQGRDSLDYCLGTRSTARGGQVRRWRCYLSIQPLSWACPEDATSATTTRPYVKGNIRQYYHRIFPVDASSMSSESILLLRGGTGVWTWSACAEREGKLKIKAYWNFRGKQG